VVGGSNPLTPTLTQVQRFVAQGHINSFPSIQL
jgi:hypothetical protein